MQAGRKRRGYQSCRVVVLCTDDRHRTLMPEFSAQLARGLIGGGSGHGFAVTPADLRPFGRAAEPTHGIGAIPAQIILNFRREIFRCIQRDERRRTTVSPASRWHRRQKRHILPCGLSRQRNQQGRPFGRRGGCRIRFSRNMICRLGCGSPQRSSNQPSQSRDTEFPNLSRNH